MQRRAVQYRLHADDVGLELTQRLDADMLSGAALLLGLTLAGNIVSCRGAFSANFTSSGHRRILSNNV